MEGGQRRGKGRRRQETTFLLSRTAVVATIYRNKNVTVCQFEIVFVTLMNGRMRQLRYEKIKKKKIEEK